MSLYDICNDVRGHKWGLFSSALTWNQNPTTIWNEMSHQYDQQLDQKNVMRKKLQALWWSISVIFLIRQIPSFRLQTIQACLTTFTRGTNVGDQHHSRNFNMITIIQNRNSIIPEFLEHILEHFKIFDNHLFPIMKQLKKSTFKILQILTCQNYQSEL